MSQTDIGVIKAQNKKHKRRRKKRRTEDFSSDSDSDSSSEESTKNDIHTEEADTIISQSDKVNTLTTNNSIDIDMDIDIDEEHELESKSGKSSLNPDDVKINLLKLDIKPYNPINKDSQNVSDVKNALVALMANTYSDDLDTLRKSTDFNEKSLPMLVKSLSSGINCFDMAVIENIIRD